MSIFSYPFATVRGRALVALLTWVGVSTVTSRGAIVEVTLQQAAAPASPGPADYATNTSIAYVSFPGFSTPTANAVRFSFSDLFLYGGQFFNLTQLAAAFPAPGPYSLGGGLPLASVALNVTLHDREPQGSTTGETWASDLTILIAPNDGTFSSPTLQLGGGATDFGASSWILWSEASTQPVPYAYSDLQSLSPGIALASSPAPTDPVIWVGSGFDSGAGASYGRWSGYLEFTFASAGGSGVPDASRTALLLAPGTLLLLGLAGRSRRRG